MKFNDNNAFNLLENILFIKKYSNKVKVTSCSLESDFILINLSPFSNVEFSIETKHLYEIVKYNCEFYIEEKNISYSYMEKLKDCNIEIFKQYKLPNFNPTEKLISETLSTVKIDPNIYKCLSDDTTTVIFKDGDLYFLSSGIVRTKFQVPSMLVEGKSSFICKVNGAKLRILEDLNKDNSVTLSYCKSCLVIFKFDNDCTMGGYLPVIY